MAPVGSLPSALIERIGALYDQQSVALREVTRLVREDDRLVPVLLPLGDGLLVAAKVS